MYGAPLNVLRQNMECLVLDWQSAADWTQRRSIKASVGPKKDSHVGHLQTVFQKFWHQQVQEFKILQSL